MTRYAVIDLANLCHRARFAVKGDAFTKAGMTLNIVFRSLRKLHRDMKVDHLVFCAEGRSWRYDVYPAYKRKRKLDRMNKPAKDLEEDEIFFSVMDDFTTYIATETRCTVLQSEGVEGDDFVARWIQLHPNDEHVILSGDSDFIQLLAPNVTIVDGVQEIIINTSGVTNYKGETLAFTVDPAKGKLKIGLPLAKEKKKHDLAEKERATRFEAGDTGEKKASKAVLEKLALSGKIPTPALFQRVEYSFVMEPEWWKKALFLKVIRGDSGDGIFAAYPGVRYEGTKKSTGLKQAWDDRHEGGYAWNNIMLGTWSKLIGVDDNGNDIKQTVRVIDEYNFNEMLIDLTKQPDNVKELMDTVIVQAVQKERIDNVGFGFMKFCGRQELPALADEATYHAAYLNQPYAPYEKK